MTTLAPITTIVTALPSTGYIGQVVVLESTGHIYSWTGSGWTNASSGGGGGGGLSDGDYGDITVSGGGTAMAIDAGAVTTTKLGGDITAAGKALLDDADATAQKATLGVDYDLRKALFYAP